MMKKMKSIQGARIARIFEVAVDTLELSEDEAERVIAEGCALQEQVKSILQKLAMVDQRFGPAVKDFEFTVPADYNHDTQLDTFAEKTKKLPTTYYFNDDLSGENFAKATNKLVPGREYRVRIFPILETVTNEDCITFLKKQGAILVGGQGITLLQDNKADEFPVSKLTVSLDEKDALREDSGGRYGVPCVHRHSEGDWGFYLGYFEVGWDGGSCLLCFSDL
jgi:hypothetical protein